uniref:Uncharacterized protein n=1 Tax=Panagrolaimus sp. ES5 TaxID=591445 RepID=A0AC34F874_9BILA
MGSINPARDFGPRLFLWVAGYSWEAISFNDYKWFWIPIVGPLIGGVVGGYGYDILIGWHQPEISPELDPNRGQRTIGPDDSHLESSNSHLNSNKGNRKQSFFTSFGAY